MKRKQKSPRRTRRQIPFKPADYAEQSSIPGNAKEKQHSTEENSAISTNYSDDSTRKGKTFPYEMNKFKETNIVDSKVSVQTENSSSNNLKPSEKKQEKMEVNSEGSAEISTEHVRQNSINSSILECNLNWSQENLAKNDAKNSTAFVNFSNESEDGNMPVILNVFTLSQEPTYIKKKTTNVICENNFPVTPPCSPPLPKREQFTGTRKHTFSQSGLTALKKAATTSNVYNICCPVKNVRESVIDGAHIFPTEIKEFIHHGNSTPERQITKFYNANGGAKMKDSELKVVSSSKISTVFSGNGAPAARKLKTQPLKNSPVIELTETTSYSTAKCVGESEDGEDDRHVFLTPRDAKVLQLKRRLQQQEAALKKLRANH